MPPYIMIILDAVRAFVEQTQFITVGIKHTDNFSASQPHCLGSLVGKRVSDILPTFYYSLADIFSSSVASPTSSAAV